MNTASLTDQNKTTNSQYYILKRSININNYAKIKEVVAVPRQYSWRPQTGFLPFLPVIWNFDYNSIRIKNLTFQPSQI